MDIYINGDLEFADMVFKGIAALYSTTSDFSTAAGALIALYLLWSFLQWGMDPERSPYPFREFMLGIFFWLMLGGGPIAPKFNVVLISDRTGHSTTIDDVPFLAAGPSWFVTSFFRSATNVIRNYFVVPGYEYMNVSTSNSDPLAALVKVAEISSSRVAEPYADRTIREYMINCYAPYMKLTGRTYANNIDTLLKANMNSNLWATVAIDTDLLETMYYTETTTESKTCQQVHALIAPLVTLSSAPVAKTTFAERAYYLVADSGISSTDLQSAGSIINAHLTGAAPINPYQFQVNLFLASAIKEGASKSSMQTWADKMVFEASQKRAVESAGAQTLFMKIYISSITVIEMFAVFITPLMMLLVVMGSAGIKMIQKYMVLILFINLWGFIKVFVDLFQVLAVRRAFQSVSATPEYPLTFANYANNIQEIQTLLGFASSLTMVTPFLAMFILYQGVHSLMGVMRTVSGGSVDGSNMAPNIASTMSNGAYQQGDMQGVHNVSQDSWYTNHVQGANREAPTMALGQSQTNDLINAQTVNTQASAQATRALAQSITQTDGFKNMWSSLESGTNTKAFKDMTTDERVAALSYAVKGDSSMSQQEATDNVFQAAVAGGGSISLSTPNPGSGAGAKGSPLRIFSADAAVEMKAALQASGKIANADTLMQTKTALDNWMQSGKSGINFENSDQMATSNTTGTSGERSQAAQTTEQSLQQLTDNATRSQQISAASKLQDGIAWERALPTSAMMPVMDKNAGDFWKFYDNLREKNKLDWVDSTNQLRTKHSGNAMAMFADVTEQLGRGYTEEQVQKGHHAASQLWERASSYFAGNDMKSPMLEVAQRHDNLAHMFGMKDDTPSHQYSNVHRDDSQKVVPPSADKTINNANEQFVSANANVPAKEDINKRTNDIQQQQAAGQTQAANAVDATNKSVNVQGSEVKKPTPMPTADMQQVKENTSNIEGPNQNMIAAATMAATIPEVIDDVRKFFSGNPQLWGKDSQETAQRFASLGAKTGYYTDAVKKGWEELATAGLSRANNAWFKDGKPTSEAYAINDSLMLLKKFGGDNWKELIPNDANGQHFLQAVGAFALQKQHLPESTQQQMDALSANRLSGALPNKAAETLITNANKAGGPTALSRDTQNITDERGAMAILENNPLLKNNPHLAAMAGYDNKIPDNYRPSEKDANQARHQFTGSESNRIMDANAFTFENGNLVPGVNRDYNHEDLKEGIENYLLHAANGTPINNSQWLKDAQSDQSNPGHPEMMAAMNSGLGNLGARLNTGGFLDEGKKIERMFDDTSRNASAYYLATSPETAQFFQDQGTKFLNNEQLNTSVGPVSSMNPEIISNTTSLIAQGGKATNQIAAAHIQVANYESGISIYGNVRSQVYPAGQSVPDEASERLAQASFMHQARAVAMDYENNRVGFEIARSNNGNTPPESFQSRGGQHTFTRTEFQGAKTLYHSDTMGDYIFDPNKGQTGEFLPAADNPHFNFKK